MLLGISILKKNVFFFAQGLLCQKMRIVSLAVRSTHELRPLGLSIVTRYGRKFGLAAARVLKPKEVYVGALHRRAAIAPTTLFHTFDTKTHAKTKKSAHSRISRIGRDVPSCKSARLGTLHSFSYSLRLYKKSTRTVDWVGRMEFSEFLLNR